jgi:hypothetical protein
MVDCFREYSAWARCAAWNLPTDTELFMPSESEHVAGVHTAIKQGKALLFQADQGESFVSMEGGRVDRISEFSE